MRAPVSQIRAAELPAATEQLALVAALAQRMHDARASWLGMPAVLFEDQCQVLPDELRTRNAALASGAREQPVDVRIQRNGRRLLPGKCHGSNMTRRTLRGQGWTSPLERL